MPPTIRRSWHDCWKKGATKSCRRVDHICFTYPASVSASPISASRVILLLRSVVLSACSAVHKIQKSVASIMCRPQIGQISCAQWNHPGQWERRTICLISHPEGAERIDRKSHASDQKRRHESLQNVSNCWTNLLPSLKTWQIGFDRFLAPLHGRSWSSRCSQTHGASELGLV